MSISKIKTLVKTFMGAKAAKAVEKTLGPFPLIGTKKPKETGGMIGKTIKLKYRSKR
tara:strand:+ start:2468 stop:2638 length:171 start_codon:yes stop_codon:yes gene_type:complete